MSANREIFSSSFIISMLFISCFIVGFFFFSFLHLLRFPVKCCIEVVRVKGYLDSNLGESILSSTIISTMLVIDAPFLNFFLIFFYFWWILSYIEMKQPWIYMCSPSRSPLPPPSPPAPSRFSHCTRSEHLSHASNLGW